MSGRELSLQKTAFRISMFFSTQWISVVIVVEPVSVAFRRKTDQEEVFRRPELLGNFPREVRRPSARNGANKIQ